MSSKIFHQSFKYVNENKSKCSVCKSIQGCLKKCASFDKTSSTVPYLCYICFQKVSPTEISVTENSNASKSNKRKFDICKSSHKNFFLKQSINKSLSTSTRENTQLMCEFSVEKSSNKENLKRYSVSYNKNLSKYICKVCKKVCSSLEEIKTHHFTHIRKYELCKTCKRKTSSVRKQQSELCEICEENLLLKKMLKQHCLSHENKEVEKKLSKTILKMHCLVLLPSTPFVCGICKDGFSSKKELFHHYPVHTGEKSHEWTNCEETHSPLFKI